MAARDPRLRAFVKIDKQGQVVPGTLILRLKQPAGGRWLEIQANTCCSQTQSDFDFTLNSGTGNFSLTVANATIANTPHSEGGTFLVGTGNVVASSVTGAGPNKSLLVVDESNGIVLSNQTGTTGPLSFSFTAIAGHAYTIIGVSGTTTTSTTSTSTTTTTT